MAEATRARFPAAYIPSAEHFHLKNALHAFKGGDLVMTLPPPPQRCPPSPYERACLIASMFKQKKIPATLFAGKYLIERDKLEMFKSNYDPRPGRKPIRRLL